MKLTAKVKEMKLWQLILISIVAFPVGMLALLVTVYYVILAFLWIVGIS
jgi:hypothetical protein